MRTETEGEEKEGEKKGDTEREKDRITSPLIKYGIQYELFLFRQYLDLSLKTTYPDHTGLHLLWPNSLFLQLHTSFHTFYSAQMTTVSTETFRKVTKTRTVDSVSCSVCRLAESACIQAPPWAELIYVAAQRSKPRVRSHTVLQGAV